MKRRVAVIVLAAGAGRRMGGPKVLLPWRRGTFLEAVLDASSRVPGIVCRVVVLGARAGEVSSQVPIPDDVTVVVNGEWAATGMLGSVRCGLDAAAQAMGDDPDAILIWPVDHPAVRAETLAALLAEPGPVVIPVHAGRRGHPALLARETFDALRAETLPEGVRSLIRSQGDRVRERVVPDPAVCMGVNEPGDLLRLQRLHVTMAGLLLARPTTQSTRSPM